MTLLQDLTASRNLLVTDGWVAGMMRDPVTGGRCAIAAILDSTGNEELNSFTFRDMNERGVAAVDAVYDLLPGVSRWAYQPSLVQKACAVADYNNREGEQQTIKLFEDAMDAIIIAQPLVSAS